jgi:hemoglobin
VDIANTEGLRSDGITRVGGQTMLEHIGGRARVKELVTRFHAAALADELLGEMFARGGPAHTAHLAAFFEEIMGGRKGYTKHHNGVAGLFDAHAELGITEQQRRRFVDLMMAAADSAGLPTDQRFRAAFLARIEQGSMFSKTLSQPEAHGTGNHCC